MNHTNGAGPSTVIAATGLEVNGLNTPNGKAKLPNGIIVAINGGPSNTQATHAKHGAKLSINATAFNPKEKATPISYLNRGSSADDIDGKPDDNKPDDSGPLIVSSDVTSKANCSNGKGKGKAVQEPIGTWGENFSPSRKVFFTTDVGPGVATPGGHYIKITNIRAADIPELMKPLHMNVSQIALLVESLRITPANLFMQHNWTSKLRGSHCPPKQGFDSHHDMFFAFNDLRDASAAFQEIHMINTNVNVAYVAQPEYFASSGCGNGEGPPSSYFDGQVVFRAQFEGLTSEMEVRHLFDEIQELAKTYGELLAFMEQQCGGTTLQFRAEYYKISDAKGVVGTLTKMQPKQLGVSRRRKTANCA